MKTVCLNIICCLSLYTKWVYLQEWNVQGVMVEGSRPAKEIFEFVKGLKEINTKYQLSLKTLLMKVVFALFLDGGHI